MPKVAINGIGRIGRATFKILLNTPGMELVAVNDLLAADNLAYLLRYDTVYGRYEKKVEHRDNALVVEGREIRLLNQGDPGQLPWRDMGVDLVFECSGIFTRREDMERHLHAGARHVILSAPSKSDDVPTVVYGVNTPEQPLQLVSTASCTTNCITPVAEVIGRRIGFKKAILDTIHAYTASQRIVDGPAAKWRRGRAAAANLVPTTTGAARATTRVLPQYQGRFDGIAIRVPLAVGSVADLTFLTERRTSVDEVNGIFREEAASLRYQGVLGVSEDPIVSSDIIKDERAAIFDLTMTQVVDGDLVKVLAWYDNEWGYAAQMVRVARRMAL